MFKRLFLIVFGLGLGLVVGAIVMRRIDQAAQAVSPNNLAGQAGRAAATLGSRLRAAWAETKVAAAEKEAELRSEFNVPRAGDLLRPPDI
ncbi:MAG TPA: hypothetical protein VGA69_06430 [Nitriliruptorales bacterium]